MTRLIDADALLKAIKPLIYRMYNYEKKAIADLITNAPTVQREGWVSVEDRLPEKGTCVLVFKPNVDFGYRFDMWDLLYEAPLSFSSATLCVGEGWQEHDFDEITHWQPLPAAPTDTE